MCCCGASGPALRLLRLLRPLQLAACSWGFELELVLGVIHKCSKAYSSQYLETYFGHHMPVYNVNCMELLPPAHLALGLRGLDG